MAFTPRPKCTVASGDCFTAGRCLGGCQSVVKRDHESRILDLERRLKIAEAALAEPRTTRPASTTDGKESRSQPTKETP